MLAVADVAAAAEPVGAEVMLPAADVAAAAVSDAAEVTGASQCQ